MMDGPVVRSQMSAVVRTFLSVFTMKKLVSYTRLCGSVMQKRQYDVPAGNEAGQSESDTLFAGIC